jgi:V-type H+-transporting ATPase subunit a
MEYISLIVNEDAAHDTLADLGKLSAIQFTDLNPDLTPFQRRYVSFVRRCDELERKLRFFGNECDNFGLNLETAGDIENFLESNVSILSGRTGSGLSAGGGGKGTSGTQLLENLEVELEGKNDRGELGGRGRGEIFIAKFLIPSIDSLFIICCYS